MTINIASVVGARPQFIKAAPINRAFTRYGIKNSLIHTGQHFDENMSDIFFKQLEIDEPTHNLNIHGGPHGDMTARMLSAIENILTNSKPDALLVYGDTNSTLAGSLAASKLNIPVFHVEAGLRSFNKTMPEEINRVLTDHVSALLFTPTKTAVHNLEKEGITKGVIQVGDVMYDSCLHAQQSIKKPEYDFPYALMTLHRQSTTENIDTLKKSVEYANSVAEQNNLKIIFPIHPRTKKLYEQANIQTNRIITREPVGYFETQSLLKFANLVLTDSGGLQKEAYFHHTPCITLRSETEWTETIDSGWNKLWTSADWKNPRTEITDYGTGNAAELITQSIIDYFK